MNASTKHLVVILALVWFGLVLGVSFLATPVKFMAPSLDLPVALDVGRHTFAALNWLELFALAALGAALLLARAPRLFGAAWLALAVILAIQTFWLLPVLDARVGVYLAGDVPPESGLHTLYPLVEGLKLLVLLAIGIIGLRGLAVPVAARKEA